jgi:hypothetical protein
MKEKFIIMMKTFILLNLPITLLILYSCNSNNITLFNYEVKKIPQIEIHTMNDLNKKSEEMKNNNKKSYFSDENLKDNIKLSFADYQKYAKFYSFDETDYYLKNLSFENLPSNDKNNNILPQKMQKRKVILIGDSLGQGLSWGFEKYADDYNIHFKSFAKQSTTTKDWYHEANLEEEIKNFNPDIILISLGANEFSGNNIISKLNIMKLKHKINQYCTKLIWILPPIEKAKEYNNIVKEIFTDKMVFDSNQIELPRGKDKVHPTRNGFFQWTNIIYNCCMKNKLEKPECVINGNS